MNKLALSLLMTAVCLSASTALVAQSTVVTEDEISTPEKPLGPGGTQQLIGGGGKTDTPAVVEYTQFYNTNKAAINKALGAATGIASKDSLDSFLNTTFGGKDGRLDEDQINALSRYYSPILAKGNLTDKEKAEVGFLFSGKEGKIARLASLLASSYENNLNSVMTANSFFDKKIFGKPYKSSVEPNGLNRILGGMEGTFNRSELEPLMINKTGSSSASTSEKPAQDPVKGTLVQ